MERDLPPPRGSVAKIDVIALLWEQRVCSATSAPRGVGPLLYNEERTP